MVDAKAQHQRNSPPQHRRRNPTDPSAVPRVQEQKQQDHGPARGLASPFSKEQIQPTRVICSARGVIRSIVGASGPNFAAIVAAIFQRFLGRDDAPQWQSATTLISLARLSPTKYARCGHAFPVTAPHRHGQGRTHQGWTARQSPAILLLPLRFCHGACGAPPRRALTSPTAFADRFFRDRVTPISASPMCISIQRQRDGTSNDSEARRCL